MGHSDLSTTAAYLESIQPLELVEMARSRPLCVLRIRLGSDFGYSRDQEAAIKPLLATHSDGEGRLRETIRRLGREATVDTQ